MTLRFTDVIFREKLGKNKKLRMPAMQTVAVGTYNRYRSLLECATNKCWNEEMRAKQYAT